MLDLAIGWADKRFAGTYVGFDHLAEQFDTILWEAADAIPELGVWQHRGKWLLAATDL